MTFSQKKFIQDLIQNKGIKTRLLGLIESTESLSEAVLLLEFAENAGLLSKGKVTTLLEQKLTAKFQRPLSVQDEKFICGEHFPKNKVKVKASMLGKRKMRVEDLGAIGCLKSGDPLVHQKVASQLDDQDIKARKMSTYVLGSFNPQEKALQLKLVKNLKDSDKNVRSLAIVAVGRIQPLSKDAQLEVAGLLKDHDPHIQSAAAQALQLIRPKDKDVINALIGAVPKLGSEEAAIVFQIMKEQ